MGAFARYPIALAPGMGLNAYFTYTVVKGMGVPWETALGAVFLSGVAFLILTLLGYADDHLTVRSVKLFADGALGSRGAALLAPYSDQPDQRGLLFMSDADMEGKIETALRDGYQVNVHAIGDAANRQVLDGFEAAYKAVGGQALRNRIEHAGVDSVNRQRIVRVVLVCQQRAVSSDHATQFLQDRNVLGVRNMV